MVEDGGWNFAPGYTGGFAADAATQAAMEQSAIVAIAVADFGGVSFIDSPTMAVL